MRRAPTSVRRRSTRDRDIAGSVRPTGAVGPDLRRCSDGRDRPPRALGRRSLVGAVGARRRAATGRTATAPAGRSPARRSTPPTSCTCSATPTDLEYTSDPPDLRARTSPAPPVERGGRRAAHPPGPGRDPRARRRPAPVRPGPRRRRPSPTSRRWPATAWSWRPNPDLPGPVVATAWLFKRTCDAVDADALQEFVDERVGQRTRGLTAVATDAWGIDDGWIDTDGRWQPRRRRHDRGHPGGDGRPGRGRPVWVVRPGAAEVLHGRCHLRLEDGTDLGDRRPPAADLPLGLHDLRPLDGGPATTLLVSPGRCHLPDDLRAWGVVVQVPTRPVDRRAGASATWPTCGRWPAGCTSRAAGSLALSPLHAPTPVRPIPTSPYSPSSRRWRSPLLLRVDEVPGGADARRSRRWRAEARRSSPTRSSTATRAGRCQRAGPRAPLGATSTTPAQRGARRLAGRAGRAARGLGPLLRPRRAARRPAGASWPAELRHPDGAGGRPRPRPRSPTGSPSTPGSSCSLDEQLDARPRRRARASSTTSPSAPTPAAPTPGCGRTCSPTGFSIGAPPDDFEPDGQRWGLPPVDPVAAPRRGLPARSPSSSARRSLAGRRAPHRPRDGAAAACSGCPRAATRPTAPTCASPAASCSSSSPSRARGPARRRRRGPRHGRARLPRGAGRARASCRPGWSGSRTTRRRRWPQPGPGHGHHPRPPDPGRRCATGVDRARGDVRAPRSGARRPMPGEQPVARAWREAVHRRLGASPAALAAATLEDLWAWSSAPTSPAPSTTSGPTGRVALPVPLEALRGRPGRQRTLDALAEGAVADPPPSCPERDSNPQALSGSGV